MSTEFYCEEFPTEQNGKPVQTLKDLLEACPEDRFHFMTPFGYVDLIFFSCFNYSFCKCIIKNFLFINFINNILMFCLKEV